MNEQTNYFYIDSRQKTAMQYGITKPYQLADPEQAPKLAANGWYKVNFWYADTTQQSIVIYQVLSRADKQLGHCMSLIDDFARVERFGEQAPTPEPVQQNLNFINTGYVVPPSSMFFNPIPRAPECPGPEWSPMYIEGNLIGWAKGPDVAPEGASIFNNVFHSGTEAMQIDPRTGRAYSSRYHGMVPRDFFSDDNKLTFEKNYIQTPMDEKKEVQQLCDRYGYGSVMQTASNLWAEMFKRNGMPTDGVFIPALPSELSQVAFLNRGLGKPTPEQAEALKNADSTKWPLWDKWPGEDEETGISDQGEPLPKYGDIAVTPEGVYEKEESSWAKLRRQVTEAQAEHDRLTAEEDTREKAEILKAVAITPGNKITITSDTIKAARELPTREDVDKIEKALYDIVTVGQYKKAMSLWQRLKNCINRLRME